METPSEVMKMFCSLPPHPGVILRTLGRKTVIIHAGMTWFGVAIRSGGQPKERWFSNHRPSNRGGAAKYCGSDGERFRTTVLGGFAALAGSVVGKPPLLGLPAAPDRNAEPRHRRTDDHGLSTFGPLGDIMAEEMLLAESCVTARIAHPTPDHAPLA